MLIKVTKHLQQMLIDKTMINAEEQDIDTNEENEEEESNEEENETTPDTEETTETAEEQTVDAVAEETVTLSKSDYERLKRAQARKVRIESKEKKDEHQGFDQDLISRTFLAAQAGIIDPDVQDEALRLSSKFGLKIDDAMRDVDISTRLRNLQKQKQTQAGIAGNGGSNTSKPRTVEQYTAEYRKTGKLPEDPRLVSKILDELIKK